MKLLYQRSRALLSGATRTPPNAKMFGVVQSPCRPLASTSNINIKRSVYTTVNNSNNSMSSLHEAAYFASAGTTSSSEFFTTVSDDGYDASHYGYRAFVRSSGTASANAHAATFVRNKSTMAHTINNSGGFHNNNNHETTDDCYAEYHRCNRFVDPQSLDILSSPEVLEILESRRSWDDELRSSNMGDASTHEDGYLSDCGEHTSDDGWEDALPSLDEKEM